MCGQAFSKQDAKGNLGQTETVGCEAWLATQAQAGSGTNGRLNTKSFISIYLFSGNYHRMPLILP